jgi:predicted Fe-Mo cluster-binding NifX family protein
MKIAVLQHEGRVFPQCKECRQVAIVEVDPLDRRVQGHHFHAPPAQAAGELGDWLRQENIETLLTSGISQRDRELLEAKGIEVIVGVPPFRLEPVIANYLAGTLQTGANLCEYPAGDGQ